jgi:serine acetyltransferase
VLGFQIGPGSHIFMGTWFDCKQNFVMGQGSVAVVTRSVPPYKIVAGAPARSIGERPRELHYDCRYAPFFV